MMITYFEEAAKEKKIPLYKVNIKQGKELVLRDETSCQGGLFSKTKVYATTVTITPTSEFPDVLDFYHTAPIKTEVICQYHLNGRGACQ